MKSTTLLKGALCALTLALMPASGVLAPTAYAAPPPVEDYAQLPGVWDAAISPDGKTVAAIAENDGGYIVRFYELDNLGDTRPKAVALEGNSRIRWVRWASDDWLLVSIAETIMYQNRVPAPFTHIVKISRDAQDVDILIEADDVGSIRGSRVAKSAGARQFNDYIIDILPEDPNHILMGFSTENVFATDAQKVNLETSRYSIVHAGGVNTQSFTTDNSGRLRVMQGRKDNDGSYTLMVRKADSDEWLSYSEYSGLNADETIFGFMENPNHMIVGRTNGADTLGLFIYDLAEQKIIQKLYQNADYDVSDIIRSADGKRVVGAVYTAEDTEKVFFDPNEEARMDRIRKAAEGYTISYLDQTADGSKSLVLATSPDVPTNLLLFDHNSGQISFIASAYPNIASIDHGYVQSVSYTSRDGVKIPAFVTIPAKAMDAGQVKNLPYIVMPHGGPFARDTARFDWLAQLFASRGYGVLQMNFRGSTGYGVEFTQAGRDRWEVMQEDVEDGTRWLIEKGYADPDRICIVGWSYGGYSALLSPIQNPDLYQCAASIAGVTDLNNLLTDMRDYRFGRFSQRDFVLRGFDGSRDLKAFSPQQRADEINIPVFLAHGTLDVRVHYDQFTRMEKALKRAGKDVTSVSIKEGDHGLTTNGNDRVKVFKALDKFLIENLGESEWSQ